MLREPFSVRDVAMNCPELFDLCFRLRSAYAAMDTTSKLIIDHEVHCDVSTVLRDVVSKMRSIVETDSEKIRQCLTGYAESQGLVLTDDKLDDIVRRIVRTDASASVRDIVSMILDQLSSCSYYRE